MASENYLEEALNAEVDETAVNAIMKTLEIQLNSTSVSNQQENSAVLLNDSGNNETEVSSSIQECEVTNVPYCVAENPTTSNIPSIIAFSKSINNDQPVVMPAIHSVPDDRQMDSCITQQSDGSVQLTENLKPLFLSGTKIPNRRPMFQSRSLPNNNIGFSLFPTQTMIQATINEKDGTAAQSQSTNPLLVNVGNLPSPAENMKPESKGLMIKCTTSTTSTSDSPLLMNIITVPITAPNSAKVSETHTTTINSSRMIGRVALPKTIAPTAGPQHIEGSIANPIIPNNVQVLSVIPLKPGTTPSKQGQKNMMPRMVIGAPQMMGNRVGPQVKMAVQPQHGQDGKGSSGHLLLKNQNGQYQWVRVNVAATRSGPAIAAAASAPPPPNTNTSTSTPTAVGQSIIALPKPNSSELNVGAPLSALPNQNVKVQSISNDLLTKEKCQTFLGKILELANTKGSNIKKNIYNLTQDLIDGKIDVEYFTHYLEVLLNSKNQFAFTDFFKKSLPLIRHSLATKELVLDGIRAPPYYVCLPANPQVTVVPNLSNQTSIVSCTASQPSQQSILIQPSIETTSNFKSRELFWQTPTQFHTKVLPNNASNKAPGVAQINLMESPNTNKSFGIINQSCFGQSLIRPRASAIKSTSVILPQQPSLTSTSDVKIPSTSISNIHQHSSSVTFQNEATMVGSVEHTYDQTKAETSLETDMALSTKEYDNSPSKAIRASEKLSKDKYYSFIDYSSDDINSITSGVNLDDESQKILDSDVRMQNRSSQDESFLNTGALLNKIKQITVTHGLKEPSSQVATLISQACEENIKSLLEKLSIIAAHRTTKLHMNIQHEVIRDVKGQLKFLEEIDQIRKRHQDENDYKYDSGYNKMKGKHKKALRAEMVELRQQEANQTALQAIGFRKKTKFGNETNSNNSVLAGNRNLSAMGSSEGCIMVHAWPRIKRVSMQDMVFLLEQEKHTRHSLLLYKAYFKR
ncbi:hypothetical protein R5R35_007439 [Gryllus longicercus]|uniref:TAFH domain-containing protein n=1 Tax=Gryllus longicercus TaxID=2509291 RepID=A0AAN9Z0Y3_9ORTH